MNLSPERSVRLDELMPVIREQLAQGNSVSFSPRGVSMLPMLRQGRDTVELSPLTGRLKKYDLPLYRRDNGQYVLHRVVEADETYTCVGDNQFELERGLRHDQMIALVTAFTRNGKRIAVDNIWYLRYSCFWVAIRPVRRIWIGIRRLLGRVKRRFF